MKDVINVKERERDGKGGKAQFSSPSLRKTPVTSAAVERAAHEKPDRRTVVSYCTEVLQSLVAHPELLFVSKFKQMAIRCCGIAVDCIGAGGSWTAAWLLSLQQSLLFSVHCHREHAQFLATSGGQTLSALWTLHQFSIDNADYLTANAAYTAMMRHSPTLARAQISPAFTESALKTLSPALRVVVLHPSAGTKTIKQTQSHIQI